MVKLVSKMQVHSFIGFGIYGALTIWRKGMNDSVNASLNYVGDCRTAAATVNKCTPHFSSKTCLLNSEPLLIGMSICFRSVLAAAIIPFPF